MVLLKMKIILKPSTDQSDLEFKQHSVCFKTETDDDNLEEVCELVIAAVTAYGFSEDRVREMFFDLCDKPQKLKDGDK